MSMSGWVTSDEPAGWPWPVITLSTPLRQHLARELGQLDRGDRRGLGRLEHDRAAGGQRRADLPDGHHQRVVPGRDLAHHADRLAPDDRGAALHVLARRLALRASAPAPPKKRRLSHMNGISSSRKALRGLPASAASRSDSSSACSSSRSASLRSAAARSPGVVAAQPGKARLRGADGAVHVLLARERHLGDHLAVGRVGHLLGRAVGGVHELAVDEVLQLGLGAWWPSRDPPCLRR